MSPSDLTIRLVFGWIIFKFDWVIWNLAEDSLTLNLNGTGPQSQTRKQVWVRFGCFSVSATVQYGGRLSSYRFTDSNGVALGVPKLLIVVAPTMPHRARRTWTRWCWQWLVKRQVQESGPPTRNCKSPVAWRHGYYGSWGTRNHSHSSNDERSGAQKRGSWAVVNAVQNTAGPQSAQTGHGWWKTCRSCQQEAAAAHRPILLLLQMVQVQVQLLVLRAQHLRRLPQKLLGPLWSGLHLASFSCASRFCWGVFLCFVVLNALRQLIKGLLAPAMLLSSPPQAYLTK